jgi:hypothetical protein
VTLAAMDGGAFVVSPSVGNNWFKRYGFCEKSLTNRLGVFILKVATVEHAAIATRGRSNFEKL